MRFLISSLVLCSLTFVGQAQQPAKEQKVKSSVKPADLPLEELLSQALKDNPDIRSAEAKVRETEADLDRIRLGVMQKITKAYHDLAARRATAAEAKVRHQRARRLMESKAMSQDEFGLSEFTLQKAEAEVAELEAQLPYLVGKTAGWSRTPTTFWRGNVRIWDTEGVFLDAAVQHQPQGNLADSIRKLLDTPITGEWKDTKAKEIVAWFGDKFQKEKVNFDDRVAQVSAPYNTMNITVQIKNPLPVGAAMQLLEDLIHPHGRFVVREYGVVLAPKDSLPPGAVTVVDFWKNRPAGGQR